MSTISKIDDFVNTYLTDVLGKVLYYPSINNYNNNDSYQSSWESTVSTLKTLINELTKDNDALDTANLNYYAMKFPSNDQVFQNVIDALQKFDLRDALPSTVY